MLEANRYENVRSWLYRHARPIDLARFRFHFESGGDAPVLAALEAYRNPDGGFGHALEEDAWNPGSSPVQTWAATEIVREIGLTDPDHPVIGGILRYLESGADFDGAFWANAVPANNDFPHAPWWHVADDAPPAGSDNPTAALVGFGLRFAPPDSGLHRLCRDLAAQAVGRFMEGRYRETMHTIACFVRLFEYCRDAGEMDLFDWTAFQSELAAQISASLTRDTSTWETDYVCKPSLYFDTPRSEFFADNRALAEYECDFIERTLKPEGCWDLTWQWNGYPAEWAVSRVWWQGTHAVNNLVLLRNYGRLAAA